MTHPYTRRLSAVSLTLAAAIVLSTLLPGASRLRADQPAAKAEPKVGDLLSHEVVRVSASDASGPVEPSVAIDPANPDHIVAASQGGPGVTYASTDGGKTWKFAAAPNPLKRSQGDDAIAFTADGTALHTNISFFGIRTARPARAVTGIFLSTSKDGLTWTDPVPVVDSLNSVTPFYDKPWVAVDNVPGSPNKGSIYVPFTRFDEYGSKKPEDKTHVYFARSKDAGKTFSVPVRISEQPGNCLDDKDTLMGAMPAVGPKGEVFVVWGGPQGVVLAKSSDGGWTFGKNKVVTEIAGGWNFNVKGLGRCNGLPIPGVDLSAGKDRGTLYINWIDTRNGDPDVFVIASRDGGETWGEPVRVNDDAKGNGKEQFFTWMAVDPEDGSVNVVYYDRRDAAEDGTQTQVTLARSTDGGRTFTNHRVQLDPFEAGRGFFGDYCALDARAGRVVALFPHHDKDRIVLSAALFRFKIAPKPDVILDLTKLLAPRQSEMRLVAQRYDADRGSLNRTYNLPGSPVYLARLGKFYTDWLAALRELDADTLTEPARADLERLKETVERNRQELDKQAQSDAELMPLAPFTPVIVGLEEAKRRVEHPDSPKIAGQLNDFKKDVEKARKALDAENASADKALVRRAADLVTGLRATLKAWHDFYDGYDPLFTWWMAEPYKEADKAIQEYAAALRTKAAAKDDDKKDADAKDDEKKDKPAEPKPAVAPAKPVVRVTLVELPKESDVPNLRELLAYPQSEMRNIYQRYQSERTNAGRGAAPPGVPEGGDQTSERAARTKEFYQRWLDALERLDFDKLTADAKVDYLLVKHSAQQELRRLESGARAGEADRGGGRAGRGGGAGGGGRGGRGGSGRPIGHDGLIRALEDEMISYTPEELLAIAEKEFIWCEAEMKRASREMGLGDDWKQAVEKVKEKHVEPGRQPEMIKGLAMEAIDYFRKNNLLTVSQVAVETWGMRMMSPAQQLVNPFFLGGASIIVSFPTNTMSEEAKLQSMRGNNIHFSRATVHHELIPGHNLQQFLQARYRSYRRSGTPFWTEGWALYWELMLYQRGFPQTPEDRVGFLFWRMHRCARIVFSLKYHLGEWTQGQCVDYLVDKVGHERDNAAAEVRRSFGGGYGPLYQAAYLLGGMQIRELHKEFVDSGKMTDRAFHDTILQNGAMPIVVVRAVLLGDKLTRDFTFDWKFYGPNPGKAIEGGGR